MGLTLIRKSRGPVLRTRPKVALVLAGGAISGGAFELGGIKALEDYLVGRGLGDLDTYVGLSAGALLAVPLAAGVTPDEMIRVLNGTRDRLYPLRPVDRQGERKNPRPAQRFQRAHQGGHAGRHARWN